VRSSLDPIARCEQQLVLELQPLPVDRGDIGSGGANRDPGGVQTGACKGDAWRSFPRRAGHARPEAGCSARPSTSAANGAVMRPFVVAPHREPLQLGLHLKLQPGARAVPWSAIRLLALGCDTGKRNGARQGHRAVNQMHARVRRNPLCHWVRQPPPVRAGARRRRRRAAEGIDMAAASRMSSIAAASWFARVADDEGGERAVVAR